MCLLQKSSAVRSYMITYALLCLQAATLMPIASGESCTFEIRTSTGNVNDAGTNAEIFFAVRYREKIEIQEDAGAKKKKTKSVVKRTEVKLNKKGNDRRTGAVDSYRIDVECVPSGIYAIEIGMKGGDDAWLLAELEYTVEFQGKSSKPVVVKGPVWISGAKNDGPKKNKAHQFYVKPVKPPVFAKEQAKPSQK